MPDILKVFIDKDKIPNFMGDTDWGHRFWGAFFSVSDKYVVIFLNLVHCTASHEHSSPSEYSEIFFSDGCNLRCLSLSSTFLYVLVR